MAGFHHVEIWVADFAVAQPEWNWLLTELGFTSVSDWPDGESWAADGAYRTLTTSPNLKGTAHDRRTPGVNHLAFRADGPEGVDPIIAAAPEHGWNALYADRYPHAGGPEHYAGWLENFAGFKAEIVAAKS